MAAKYESVKCKSCARVLAVVSATGLTPTTLPDTPHAGCSTCQQFGSLYDAIRAADTDWAALENKRDSITKSFARENHMRAHMEFDNWLMTVEAPGSPRDGQDKQAEDKGPNDGDGTNDNKEQMPGTKRRRSHSPTAQRPGDISNLAPHEHQGISLSLRPSPKRSHSAAASTGRKRLKFSDTVQFHDDYRNSEQFHRPSETYVRGRNAPPEGSEYMDTSGSGLTFLRFTGMKKVGAKWVELSEDELARQSEKAKSCAELKSLTTAGNSTTGTEDAVAVDELSQNDLAPTDARAARLARRAKGASSAEPAQPTSMKSRRSREKSRKGKQLQLDGARDDVEGTTDSSTLASSTTTAHGDHHQFDGFLARVESIRDDGLERRIDAVPQTAIAAPMCADQVQDATKPHDEPHMDTQVTTEAEDQGNAAQLNTTSVEPQPTLLSEYELPQTGSTENISLNAQNASEGGTKGLLPNSLGLQLTSNSHEGSKTASTEGPSQPPGACRDACRASMQKGDIPRNDTGLADQPKPAPLKEMLAMEPTAEQEHPVKHFNTLPSPDNEPQVQRHSNAATTSVAKPQDPDRPSAARSSAEETQILAVA